MFTVEEAQCVVEEIGAVEQDNLENIIPASEENNFYYHNQDSNSTPEIFTVEEAQPSSQRKKNL